MNDTADKQREKDEALRRKREELEEELDRYAQVGAYSPGLLKASRWVSRFLYLAMAATLVFLLFSGWGKYSDEEMQRAVSRANEMKGLLDAEREKVKDRELERDAARIENMLLQAEVAGYEAPVLLADAAQATARDLIDRAWGEQAYGAHWRERLKGAEPEAHGVDPLMAAKSLIQQSVHAPAAQRIELLRETLDFGRDAVTQAVLELLETNDAALGVQALRVGVWLGGDVMTDRVSKMLLESDWPEVGFAYSLLKHEAPPEAADELRFVPESWVGYATRSYDAPLDELVKAYRAAAPDQRLGLLALLAEAAGLPDAGVFKQIATSDRAVAERIIAVRWMGARKDESSLQLLEGLSTGDTALAAEASSALKLLGK